MAFDYGSSIGIVRHACVHIARPNDHGRGKVFVAIDVAGPVEVLDQSFFHQVSTCFQESLLKPLPEAPRNTKPTYSGW